MFLLKFLLFLSVTVHLSAASCLQFISTAKTPGAKYTVEGVVNREQFISYEDNIGKIIPNWMRKIISDDPYHWSRLNRRLDHDLKRVSEDVNTASPNLIKTEGDHTVQEKFGCELYKDGTVRRFWKFGYDDKDLISLDLNDEGWTAETRPDKFNIEQWEDTDTARYRTAFLQHECIDWLQKYLVYKHAADAEDARNRLSVYGIIAGVVLTALIAGVGFMIWRTKLLGFLQFISTAKTTGTHSTAETPGTHSTAETPGTHSTAETPGTDFTVVGLLENELIVSYDSKKDELTPKIKCMKEIKDKFPGHWSRLTEKLNHDLQRVIDDLNTASPNLINTEDDHAVWEIYGCKLYNDGTVRRFWKFGCDDKELISLDLNDGVWTAETRPDEFNMQQWEETHTAKNRRFFLQKECIHWLKYMKASSSTAEPGWCRRVLNNLCKPKEDTRPPADSSDAPFLTEMKPGSLKFISTANTTGTGYTVEVWLNDEKILSYDGNSGVMIPETDWMKKIKDKYPNLWGALTRTLRHNLQRVRDDVNTALPNLINTEDDHTVQEKFGCERSDDGTVRRFWKFGYNDEDLISLNLNNKVWTAVTRPDKFNMQQWDQTQTAVYRRVFLQFECFNWLQMCEEYRERAAEPCWCRRVLNNLCKSKEDPPAEAERVSLNPLTEA